MYYPIQLDRQRNLRYNMRAMSAFEKKTGMSLAALENNKEMSIEAMCALIWCGLIHEDKKLTLDDTMDLIDDYSSLGEALEIATKALEQSLGSRRVQPPASNGGSHKRKN